MTQVNDIKNAAFVASWVHSMNEPPNHFPNLSSSVQDLVTNNPKSNSTALHLLSAVDSLPTVYPGECQEAVHCTLSYMSSWRKFQHRLSSDIVQGLAENCLSTAPSALDAARLTSIQGRGAGAWLDLGCPLFS